MNASAIALVGNPNVGKSVLFHRLTGAYVNVSNYPGTTVEVARAPARFDAEIDLIDTPGVLTLPARSDDERATVRALLHEPLRTLIQVGDAKNLRRTLTLSALLAELGVPAVLALNMHDEACARGVIVDAEALSEALGIPVVPTVATGGEGIAPLTRNLAHASNPQPLLHYDTTTELAIASMAERIAAHAPHPRLNARGLAILYLEQDSEVEAWLKEAAGGAFAELAAIRDAAHASGVTPAALAHEPGEAAGTLAARVTKRTAKASPLMAHRVGQWIIHRFWAWPILLGVLYVVYEFVGIFGAGTLIGLMENDLFGGILNPAVTQLVERHISVLWLADLLVGQYGLWTMGMTYALALILPIVTTFFIAFGLLEIQATLRDCPYSPTACSS
ncbi:MAG: FeoB small GTPase domain-containing protein [Thiobacillus sp.]